MIEAITFRSQARGCIRAAIPLGVAALSLFFLLVSTDISRACAGAAKAAKHAKIAIAAVELPSESTLQKVAIDVIYVASATAASASKLRASKCCNASGNHRADDACAKGCCASCTPVVFASSDNFTLIDISCAYVDWQGSAVFNAIPSPAFRPPRTIA